MKNCTSCYYCFACTNLVHKKFCIENIQYSEIEYNKLLNDKTLTKEQFDEKLNNIYNNLNIQ